jgi:hypothetical protein
MMERVVGVGGDLVEFKAVRFKAVTEPTENRVNSSI